MFNRWQLNHHSDYQHNRNDENNRNQNAFTLWDKIKLGMFAAYVGLKLFKQIKDIAKVDEQDFIENQQEENTFITGDLEMNSTQEQQLSEFEEFVCPISMSTMRNPVVIGCGHTFDNENIRKWLQRSDQCPLCNKPAQYKDAKPNYSIRSLMEKKLKNNQYKLMQNL